MSRRLRRVGVVLIALLGLAVPMVAGAQDRGAGCQLLTAGNDFYTIYTWDDSASEDCNVGAYGVLTGLAHPAGQGLDLLQEGEQPETSFNTVFSYSTNTAYLLSDGGTIPASRGTNVIAFGPEGEASMLNQTTLQIVYDTDDLDVQDDLEITVTLTVEGTELADSLVHVYTEVENPENSDGSRGDDGTAIGIRYLWDLAINDLSGLDTGPGFYTATAYYTAEASFNGADRPSSYEAVSNDGASQYSMFGSGTDIPAGTTAAPDRIDYVCAPEAAAAEFSYTLQALIVAFGDSNCSPSPTGDSGIAYYWDGSGVDATRGGPPGYVVEDGESFTAGASMWSPFFQNVEPELCLTVELDATQVANQQLGVPGLQNNDVVCSGTALDFQPEPTAQRGSLDFEMLFDGSDVGITRTIIDGMDVLEEFSIPTGATRGDAELADILLSFNAAHSIPPIGLVLPADIIRFVADDLGLSTAGEFERFFDGSDIGLQSAGEDIDAFYIDMFPDVDAERGGPIGNFFFSTKGNMSIPGLTAQDEDIVGCLSYAFTLLPGGDIESTCGEIFILFDGTGAGLGDNAGEDVDAFSFGPEGLYLSTRGNFALNGITGRNEDIFACEPTILANRAERGGPGIPSCATARIAFDGSEFGIGANNVFSIDLLQPACALGSSRGPVCPE